MASLAEPPAVETPDFWAVLNARAGRKPGRIYKAGGQSAYLDGVAAELAEPADRAAMSARFCICTGNPDREEDVIVPEGVSLDAYRLNAICLWDHGFSGLTLPIGTSEDPAGNLAVSVSPNQIDASIFFSQTLPEAEQIFQLVDEGLLKAASIHVNPTVFSVRADRGPDQRPGLLVTASEMIEWSLTSIGCNPEALRKTLSDGRLAGKPIAESIKKSLRAHAAPTSAVGIGWTPQPAEPVPMAKSLPKSDEKPEDAIKRLRKEYDDATGDDDAAKAKRKSLEDEMKSIRKSAGMSEGDDDIPDEPGMPPKDAADGDDIMDADAPLGSQILGAAHSAVKDIADQLENATGPLENTAVKDYLGAMGDALREHMSEMNDLHKAEYPDRPELTKEDAPEDDEPKDDATEGNLAKFLARSRTNRMAVKHLAGQLLQLGSSKNIPKSHREQLNKMSRRLAGISKSAEKGAVTALSVDDAKRYDALEAKIDQIANKINDAIPHRRK